MLPSTHQTLFQIVLIIGESGRRIVLDTRLTDMQAQRILGKANTFPWRFNTVSVVRESIN